MIRDGEYNTIRLIDGSNLSGPWIFESDGYGGMYPRFVRPDDGAMVPWHSVLYIFGKDPG